MHVSFRDSVLTWYLREALTGNSRTTMLACVSPARDHEEETFATLRLAELAKQIKTKATNSEGVLKKTEVNCSLKSRA